jgi:hypothetical protein
MDGDRKAIKVQFVKYPFPCKIAHKLDIHIVCVIFSMEASTKITELDGN